MRYFIAALFAQLFRDNGHHTWWFSAAALEAEDEKQASQFAIDEVKRLVPEANSYSVDVREVKSKVEMLDDETKIRGQQRAAPASRHGRA